MLSALLLSTAILAVVGCDEFTEKVLKNPALPPVRILPNPGGEPIELVKDGKLQFCLVGDFKKEAAIKLPFRQQESISNVNTGRAARRMCAKFLIENFQKTVGKSPEMLECDDPKVNGYKYVVVCGKCRFTDEVGLDPDKLDIDEFVVRTFDRGVILAGFDGWDIPGHFTDMQARKARIGSAATALAATDFVERFLGARRYSLEIREWQKTYPGLHFDHFPKVENLVLPPFAYSDRPRQRIRWLKTPWRNSCSSGFFGGEAPGPFAIQKAHPDKLEDIFYRDESGRFWCDPKSYGMNLFDFTDTKLADILIDDLRNYFASNGKESAYIGYCTDGQDYIWIGQCDNGTYLQNARTRKLPPPKDPKASGMSEVYGHFYKYFAERCQKEFPGKTVVFMAYQGYKYAPYSVGKLPDNVQILCCNGTPACARSKAIMAETKRIYAEWNAITSKKCVPYTYDVRYEEEETICLAVRGYYEGEWYREMEGFIDPALTYNCMFRGGWIYPYSTYLATRCMWNPSYDVDAGIQEYFRLMHGKAAPYLKDFYYGVLDRWNLYMEEPRRNRNVFTFKIFEQGVARRLIALLDAAEAAVADAPESQEAMRTRWFAKPFRTQLLDLIAMQNLKPISVAAPRATGPIAVDGALDEPDWAKSSLPAFRRAYAGGEHPCISPETKLLWDDEGLYVSVKSTDYTVGERLWKGDTLEVMLAPSVGGSVCNLYQFVLDPANLYEDYYKQVEPPRGKEINWRAPNVKHGAKQAEGFWTGELFIPWKDLAPGEKPKAGDVWKLNLIYNRQKPSEYVSLAPTQNNNHRIDLYATVTFEK